MRLAKRGQRFKLDRRWLAALAAVAVAAFAGWPVRMPGARAEPASASVMEPGLIVSFADAGRPGSAPFDARLARLVALSARAGETVSPPLPGVRIRAQWTGSIHSRIRDSRFFAATGRGDLVVMLNGNVVLERHGEFDPSPGKSIRFKKGDNVLSVLYTEPATGDSAVRLLWSDRPGPCDPVPPTVFRHDPADPLLARSSPAREGRTLLATMRCFACHQGAPTGANAMPELSQDAPDLDHLGDRLNRDWVACWITNPRSLRQTATMPRIFHDTHPMVIPSVDPSAVDIAAYLIGPSVPPATAIPSDPVTSARGARLFTGLGCIGCHLPGGMVDSDPTLGRMSLKFVRAKFRFDALAAFLKKPEAHYRWIKMPNFNLDDGEATSLSAFLWNRADAPSIPAAPVGDALRGKQLFAAVGCVQCHAPSSPPPPTLATPLATADFTRGCMADDPVKNNRGVDFGFTPEQLSQLRSASSAGLTPMSHDAPPEFAARQIAILKCTACHALDGQEGSWANLDQDVSTIEQSLPPRPASEPEPSGDQTPPALTWAGEKLRPSWMRSFIAGTMPYKPRQWLVARMPAFASRAAGLTVGLSLMHGAEPADEPLAPADPASADIGRGLTSRASFGCVACHGVGDQPPLAPFEAPAPNFDHVVGRLRHDYFTRWMRHPQSYIPGTKMPQFGDADGKTAYKNILGGDADAQYQAIWNYLLAGPGIAPPP